jgi:hypothetical protein
LKEKYTILHIMNAFVVGRICAMILVDLSFPTEPAQSCTVAIMQYQKTKKKKTTTKKQQRSSSMPIPM